MSLNSFLTSAKFLIEIQNYDTALCLLCCVIDSCAKKKYPSKGNADRIKLWVNDNIDAISSHGLPAIFGKNCKFCFGHEIKHLKANENGYAGIEDIIYYLIRCCLVHECDIDRHIMLVPQNVFTYTNNKIILPHTLCNGLIYAISQNIT